MSTINSDVYLQYIFLLGECTPFILRSLVRREEVLSGKTLAKVLAGSELGAKLAVKDLDSWTISECASVLLRYFGYLITRQERLEINYLSSCRAELFSRNLQSFTADDFKRMTSDLVLSLLHLSTQTDQNTYDVYQALMTEVRKLDGEQILGRIKQCSEYEVGEIEVIENFATSTRPVVVIGDEEDTTKETDSKKALRQMKESLTKAVLYGVDFNSQIVIEESIEIQGPEEEMITKATLVLLKVFNEVISGALEDSKHSSVSLGSGSLYKAVRSLVDLIQNLDGARIIEVLYGGLTLRMKCRSVKQLRKLLRSSGSNEFETALGYIASLMLQDFGVSVALKKKFLVSSIHAVKRTLEKHGVGWGSYKDLACTCGHDQPIMSYCDTHEVFCCYLCSVKDHSTCPGLSKTTENEAENLQVSGEREYFMQMEEDQDVCSINGCCILSNDDVLLTDENNRCLKRLTKDGILSRVDLPRIPYDVCTIGRDTAAVGLEGNGIQLVQNKSSLELITVLDTDHPVFGLVSDGKVIYATSGKSVYSYKTDGSERKVLYQTEASDVSFSKLALSDDGQKLYIVDGSGGLETIDTKGNRLHSLRAEELKISQGIGLAADGTVLVCEYAYDVVLRIDSEGKKVLGTILSPEDGIHQPCTLGFDKSLCKLVVGMKQKGTLLVFDMK